MQHNSGTVPVMASRIHEYMQRIAEQPYSTISTSPLAFFSFFSVIFVPFRSRIDFRSLSSCTVRTSPQNCGP